MDLAHELNRIFIGSDRGHGEFKITGNKDSKLTGKAVTVKGGLNEDHWRKHLAGELGVGAVAITSDNTCSWGAVDVDVYDSLDLEEMSNKITAPLVVCRSKSGGMHVLLFCNAPVPATLMRKKLALVARAIGHRDSELFPKQDKLVNAEDIGNWINMPYFNGDSTTRYCIRGGVILNVEEFIGLVGESSLNTQQLVAYQPEDITEGVDDTEFSDAPPCLEHLTKHGFPVGSRNSALFSMGVYARMKNSTGWEDKIFDYNKRFMGPGTYSEVAGIIRSLQKVNYVYRCKDKPIHDYCDKAECSNRLYGIKLSRDDERAKRPNILDDVTQVTLYDIADGSKDDPYYVFQFGDKKMDVTVDMARSQALFSREYFRIFKRVILPVKDIKWCSTMNQLTDPELNENLIFKTIAPDAGPEGQMWVHLETFCTGKSKARVRDEMLLGKPWHDTDRTFFRSSDFMKYLDQQRFRSMKDNDIFMSLKSRGAKHHHMNLKGKHVTCWSVESFSYQTEAFDTEAMSNDDKY